jgi:glutaredoxin-related protein
MGEIILYSTGCPKCTVLKKKLDKAQINYKENTDVSEMRSIGLLSAPALMVGDDLLLFDDAIAWVNSQEVQS